MIISKERFHEIFDSKEDQSAAIVAHVHEHLKTQGCKAVEYLKGFEHCRYRLQVDDGTVLACGVGCLMPNEYYHRCFEGNKIHSFDDFNYRCIIPPELKKAFVKYGLLLRRIQKIHDKQPVEMWEILLQKLEQDVADGVMRP